MGILMGFTNAAPSIGPILGGVLAEKLSWHWIFWLLSILGGIHLLALFKASRRWQHTPSPLDKSFHLFTYNFSQVSDRANPTAVLVAEPFELSECIIQQI